MTMMMRRRRRGGEGGSGGDEEEEKKDELEEEDNLDESLTISDVIPSLALLPQCSLFLLADRPPLAKTDGST